MIRILRNVAIGVLCSPASVYAVDGANIFDSRCTLCHQDKASLAQLPDKKIKRVLQSDSVEEHRFALSQDEVNAVVHFLKHQDAQSD